MARSDFAFSTRFRVRWAEVDAQGVVFNARYLDYADVAVTDYWDAAGVRAAEGEALDFHVARSTINYRKPIRPRETIDAFARTSRFGTTSMTQLIELHGAGEEDLRAEIELVQVHVDLATGAPTPIPDWVRARFTAFDERAARIDEPA